MDASIAIHEIYASIQGESTFAGLPCILIRLSGCPLRCSYCDSAFAFAPGKRWPLDEVIERVDALARPWFLRPCSSRLPLVELTGGEPLLQPAALDLMRRLCDAGYTTLLETSGALDISPVDPRVRRIMDLKCPSSGESERNRWDNIARLRATDEVKLVIGTLEDYRWAVRILSDHNLARICPVLFSWAHPIESAARDPSLRTPPADHTPISQRALAEQIIADALPVRFQLQIHKAIWPPSQRGV
ncbi:MAG TPA: radical SAM protein [Candidatus Paceibacterota bacterium]|nr:radical SAM protein [Verrucomicrobiota bacterium]HRZ47235.1 radical SAM protein [Candidatus Paceibacterota bacterium]